MRAKDDFEILDDTPRMAISFLWPSIVAITLFACTRYYNNDVSLQYDALIIISFLISYQIFNNMHIFRSQTRLITLKECGNIALNWILISFILCVLGHVTNTLYLFSKQILIAWFLATPLFIVITQYLASLILNLSVTRKDKKLAIIIGANNIGFNLYNRINNDRYSDVRVIGFADDRVASRILEDTRQKLVSSFSNAAEYCKTNNIDCVYIALPISHSTRILSLVDEFRDTTVSVYFVPDIYMYDLIQGHIGNVSGMPVICICDTPFNGIRGLIKRTSDIVLSILILILISPLMALIAIGVKLSSSGPIMFKQNRYGLDGDQIVVYKFRTMTVCENGENVVQATQNDKRITPFGQFLRRTSLDELPQFINVLQGRMSIVGPRPHAVAHNEMYRKLIKGYMIRHKVKPGITGLAQVNGLRGETETVDKMKERIEYDLEYLRQWSLILDMGIILKTIKVVFGQENAY